MRIIFMGTPEFALPTFRALLASRHTIAAAVTQPDRPSGRGQQLAAPAIKRAALAAGLPVYQPARMKDPEFHDRLRAHRADLFVVVAFGRILPQEILDIPPRGCVNVHGSLLPRYRGAAPIQWAILRGETETGITTIQMDAGMDTGSIYLQEKTAILPGETAGELAPRLAEIGARVLIQTLDGIESGQLHPIPQENAAATMAPVLDKDQGLVDWKQPAVVIERLVRGLDPWPGAYTFYQEDRWRLGRAQADDARADRSETPAPGTILAVGPDRLRVATGAAGVLEILELQPASRRRMAVREFISGHPVEPGVVLGE